MILFLLGALVGVVLYDIALTVVAWKLYKKLQRMGGIS